MSIEITYYPDNASKKELTSHLMSLGYVSTDHLWNWPKGTKNFHWFETKDYISADGVEASVYPTYPEEQKEYPKAKWGIHTRTRIWASSFDKDYQNHTIRKARREFGGGFYNDHYGKNRYTQTQKDERTPQGRGIWFAYRIFDETLSKLKYALPEEMPRPKHDKTGLAEIMARAEPNRVLYNAIIPFVVASLEYFFNQAFKILLQYDEKAQEKIHSHDRKIELGDAALLAENKISIEDVIAKWYSFQNVDAIHKAFHEWFGINFWEAIRKRKKVGKRIVALEKYLINLIEFRHGIIHRFELDFDLSREQIIELIDSALMLINVFVDYIETNYDIKVRTDYYLFPD